MGAKRGRAKGNKQEAEYEEPEGRHEKSGWRDGEDTEARAEVITGEATVRRGREESERKKQRLSSEMLKRKQTKGSGSQAPAPEEESKRGSPVERLRERSRAGRKETGSEAE